MKLYESGIRPAIDAHLAKLAEEKRDYGDYWSASSAGYCMRKLIFERLNIPYTSEDARKQRVFSSGDIFHEWIQNITKESGLSIVQELELQDEELMIRGHVDDLVLVGAEKDDWAEDYLGKQRWNGLSPAQSTSPETPSPTPSGPMGPTPKEPAQHLILYDYKTAHSKWFEYAKSRPVSHYNRMQVGTYLYMLQGDWLLKHKLAVEVSKWGATSGVVKEARILKISKDDLRLFEYQVLWTPELEAEIKLYWQTLNDYWKAKKLPQCSCHLYENGFMAKEKFNPYWYNGEPCSLEWYELNKEKVAV